MPGQTAGNVIAAIKRETTFGVAAASGAGALQMRLIPSAGLRLDRGVIQSQERRQDGYRAMGRLGGKSASGSFASELTIGGFTDSLFEAILRSTWSPALVLTEASNGLTSITTTTSTIVASAGSWITAGIRVGDIIRLSNHSAGNNNINLRVTGVSSSTITVAGTPLTANAVADTSFTVTRVKKLATAASLTRYSYTIEQYDADIDLSELFLGCRLTEVALSFRPNSMASVTWTFMGANRTLLVTGTSPWFTSPTVTTGSPLVADDSYIRVNGVDETSFTGLDLRIAIEASTQPLIGSVVPTDVYDDIATISGTVMGVRESFARAILYDAESIFEMGAMFLDPATSAPMDVFGFFLPRVKFSSLEAPFLGGAGPKVESLNFMSAPRDTGGSGYESTAINIYSSAA